MRDFILAPLLLLTFCVAGHARQQQHPAGGARLIDQFGEIQISDLMARLDKSLDCICGRAC